MLHGIKYWLLLPSSWLIAYVTVNSFEHS